MLSVSLLLTLEAEAPLGELSAGRRLEIRRLVNARVDAWLSDLGAATHLELEGADYRLISTGTGSD